MSVPRHRVRALVSAVALIVGAAALSACETGPDLRGARGDDSTGRSSNTRLGSGSGDSGKEGPPLGSISLNVEPNAGEVPVDTVLSVSPRNGQLNSVDVMGSGEVGALSGSIAGDGRRWRATDRLEPGTRYTVEASVRGGDGELVTRRQKFVTEDLTLDQQTYASIAPLHGETVGIGMPVTVTFDVPVTDRASIEKHLRVTSKPAQPGTWHWISDDEVRYRPKNYWKAGTRVEVDADINGVDAGNGIYGQETREIKFNVGAAHVYRVDAKTYQMKVFTNGKLLRTIPITTGEQPKYTTRSGVKVIMEKFDKRDMNSETVGITGADAYNIEGVQWAMRLTYSGEFLHAAPWSVASQGRANVSHGCTGMSTANADWLYHMTLRGDVVEYTGTDRAMEPTNGYGDWNVPWQEYKQGSALN